MINSSINCDLFILSAVTDLSFIKYTVPHILKQNKVNGKKYLRIDTSPVSGYYKNNRELSKFADLENFALSIKQQGLIDEIVKIKYDFNTVKQVYRKHFGTNLSETHCFRGYPYYGSVLPFEISDAEYIVHLDSDMLVYQHENFNWIDKAIQMMEKNQQLICCLPLSGPPTDDGKLFQSNIDYKLDRNLGAYLFKNFTSRIFIMNVKRYLSLLPMPIKWLSWREPIKSRILGGGKMLCWEATVERTLERSNLYRGDLHTKLAWSLHPPERGERFNSMIPELINKIESGWFPKKQAGHYDLNLDWWI